MFLCWLLGLLILSSGRPCRCQDYWSWFLLLHFGKRQGWKYLCYASCHRCLVFSLLLRGKWIASRSKMDWLSAGSLDVRSHVEHGMFPGNVAKATLSQQTSYQWNFINSKATTVLQVFMEKRGCKWERPLKAAFVPHQTGATSKHPDLSSHPFYLPRSLSGQSEELPCFWGIFRYGLRGRHLTPRTLDVTGVRPSRPCQTARGVAGATGLARRSAAPRGLPQRAPQLQRAPQRQETAWGASPNACALQPRGKVGCLAVSWPCTCSSSCLLGSPLKITFPCHRYRRR